MSSRTATDTPAPAKVRPGARRRTILAALLVAALAQAAHTADAFAASATDASGPLPKAAQWNGKSPNEMKPGFYANPALRAAGSALLGAKRFEEITSRWNVTAPIQADGDALLAWGCKPHDCGDNQQATLIDGGRVMICVTDAGTSHWFVPDRKQPLAAGAAGCNFETVKDARQGLAAAR